MRTGSPSSPVTTTPTARREVHMTKQTAIILGVQGGAPAPRGGVQGGSSTLATGGNGQGGSGIPDVLCGPGGAGSERYVPLPGEQFVTSMGDGSETARAELADVAAAYDDRNEKLDARIDELEGLLRDVSYFLQREHGCEQPHQPGKALLGRVENTLRGASC